MNTLTELQNRVKRRVFQLSPNSSSAASETEKGFMFSNQAIWDALNAARGAIPALLDDAGIHVRIMKTIPTSTDEQDYGLDKGVQRVLGVIWDVGSDGSRATLSVEAALLSDQATEEAMFRDPFMVPSISEPYYRVVNRALRIIVSSNGTVTTGKYILVFYRGDLERMTQAAQYSGVSDQVDDLCVEYAVSLVTDKILPSVSQKATANVSTLIAKLNQDRRLS